MRDVWAALLPSPDGRSVLRPLAVESLEAAPGTVIAARSVTPTVGAVLGQPVRRAVQVKFATTDSRGEPSFGTATVLYPTVHHAGRGPTPSSSTTWRSTRSGPVARRVRDVASAHLGTNDPDRLPPTTQWALDRGFIVVVPDHQGARMAYADPIVAGRVVLDSIRAIDNHDAALATPRPPGTLPLTTRPLGISKSPMVMSGFSGGAIAAHGAVKQLDDYAPELRGASAPPPWAATRRLLLATRLDERDLGHRRAPRRDARPHP